MKNIIVKIIIALLIVKFSVGCGTIMNSSSQNIQVSSAPDNAEIWVDGSRMGMTPTTLTLARKNEYLIKIVKPGYKEYSIKITKSTSGWIVGNLLFGGLPGCIIDGITGGCYDLSPEFVSVSLPKLDETSLNEFSVPEKTFDRIKQVQFLDENNKAELIINIQPTTGK